MNRPYERYREYIKNLEREGKSLPVNQFNDINSKQVADAENMRRQWFSENANRLQLIYMLKLISEPTTTIP